MKTKGPADRSFLKNGMLVPFIAAVAVKVIFMALFSSDYQNKLFIPFVSHFLSNFGNPWQYFYARPELGVEFPYHPLMLYILSVFYWPVHAFNLQSTVIQNLLMKLPLLISDIAIFYLLAEMFPKKVKQVFIFYFLSPIVFYISYIHSQLDIIPTLLFILSVFFLARKKPVWSAVAFGLALSTKFHVAAALPLILIYLFRNFEKKHIAYYLVIPAAIYLAFSLPYLFDPGYFHLVLANPKQMLFFESLFQIGDLKIYLSLFACAILYAKFLSYPKINKDLFYSFLAMLFASLVLLTFPSPGWYLWMMPFLTIFFLKTDDMDSKMLSLNALLSLAYLLFFIFFYIPDHADIVFMHQALSFKVLDERLRNIAFTFLEFVIFVAIYAFYRFGVQSNSIYKKRFATVIGISGDSGAGKSTIAGDILKLLDNRAAQIEGDADHKWEREDDNWDIYTHLHPKANFLHSQAEDILNLKNGRATMRKDYDHKTGKFTELFQVQPKDYVVLCGLHSFYLPKMRKITDLKVFADTDDRLRILWKLHRDSLQRGQTKETIEKQIENRKSDAAKYVLPQRDFADLVVNYYVESDLKDGTVPEMKLRLIMDSSIHIEQLALLFQKAGQNVLWDYSNDMKTQFLIFASQPAKEVIEKIADELIINMEEVCGENHTWLDGFRGIVQLTSLLLLSYKIQETEQNWSYT